MAQQVQAIGRTAKKVVLQNPDGSRELIDNPWKIEKCGECGGLIFTGFSYPDGKPYHGDCWEKVNGGKIWRKAFFDDEEVHYMTNEMYNDRIVAMFPHCFVPKGMKQIIDAKGDYVTVPNDYRLE